MHAGEKKTVGSCPYDIYDAELAIHDIALYRMAKTGDQHDYYFVPAYTACHRHQCLKGGRMKAECDQEAAAYLLAILGYVQEMWPYWERSGGRDHLVVLGLDHAGGEFEVETWTAIQPMIHLTHTGKHQTGYDFNPTKDIAIPAFRDFSEIDLLPKDRFEPTPGSPLGRRPIFAFFRGTIHTDMAYGQGVRKVLRDLAAKHPHHFYIREEHHSSYWKELRRSRYALCPPGWAPWSPRLYDAIVSGTIPVILADDWKLPFEDLLDYTEFSIRVPQEQVGDLKEILTAIPAEEEARLRRNLGRVYQHFVYSLKPFKEMDAFGSILRELWCRKLPLISESVNDDLNGGQTEEDDYADLELDPSNYGLPASFLL